MKTKKNWRNELILTKKEIRSVFGDRPECFFRFGVPKFPKGNGRLAAVATNDFDGLGNAYSYIHVVWKYKDGNGAVHSKQVLAESAYLKITIKTVAVRGKKVFITAMVKPDGKCGYGIERTVTL